MILEPEQEVERLKETTIFYKKKYPYKIPQYYMDVLRHAKQDGLWLEFGVWVGTSINLIASIMKMYNKHHNTIYGFDSFEGLPENWADPKTGEIQEEGLKGCFDLGGRLPEKRFSNIEYIKGWFDDTLPAFVKNNQKPVAMLHIDSDLYSSAKTIFDCLSDRIIPGTVIMFDEFFNYVGYEAHEYKAFREFVEKYNVKYRWLAHVEDGRQAALVVESIENI
jgi:hypothetical protein